MPSTSMRALQHGFISSHDLTFRMQLFGDFCEAGFVNPDQAGRTAHHGPRGVAKEVVGVSVMVNRQVEVVRDGRCEIN
jgi:hypothetical protein